MIDTMHYYVRISIHAPSRERRICSQFCRHYGDFNPRSLAGATKNPSQCRELLPDFNPRSLAGATWRQKQRIVWERISIHAPSRERPLSPAVKRVPADFNPRSLAGATPL